jgi:hypothetical protein
MKFNSISKSALFVLSLLLSVAGANAQTAARAKVPFAFKVGTAQMPAGIYSIKSNAGSNVFLVRNVQTGTSALAMAREGSPSKETNKLIFHHYGSQYFLSGIVGDKGSQGMVFPATRQEKALELAQAPANNVDNVEIASR